jgi:putative toxin-antitoxin system antitoxin component (TIGR02293 family)
MSIASLLENSELSPTILSDRGEYLKAIRQGVSGAIIKEAINELGERDLFISLLETTSANLNRFYHKKKLPRSAAEGVLDTLRVIQDAVSVFGDMAIAHEWLHTSIPALAGEVPINLCDTFEGRKIVKESLKAIEYGEFS